jgi:hypothetical protein
MRLAKNLDEDLAHLYVGNVTKALFNGFMEIIKSAVTV